ncbi:MAG: hypothetical protein M3N05_08445 [Pseudomonadota bacterium]|nr:hypothetical protein [Pseudomonadota bacterium]
MRRLRPLLLMLAALAVSVHAPDAAAKKHKAPPPAAKPAAAAGLRPTLGQTATLPISLPALTQPGAALVPQSLAANGFAMGGLRSGLPPMGDPASQCRAACNATRITCDDDPSTPVCAPRWAQCIAGCDR